MRIPLKLHRFAQHDKSFALAGFTFAHALAGFTKDKSFARMLRVCPCGILPKDKHFVRMLNG